MSEYSPQRRIADILESEHQLAMRAERAEKQLAAVLEFIDGTEKQESSVHMVSEFVQEHDDDTYTSGYVAGWYAAIRRVKDLAGEHER